MQSIQPIHAVNPVDPFCQSIQAIHSVNPANPFSQSSQSSQSIQSIESMSQSRQSIQSIQSINAVNPMQASKPVHPQSTVLMTKWVAVAPFGPKLGQDESHGHQANFLNHSRTFVGRPGSTSGLNSEIET